jgi:hypothetical protein
MVDQSLRKLKSNAVCAMTRPRYSRRDLGYAWVHWFFGIIQVHKWPSVEKPAIRSRTDMVIKWRNGSGEIKSRRLGDSYRARHGG